MPKPNLPTFPTDGPLAERGALAMPKDPVATGITPEDLARPGTELAHQTALFCALSNLAKERPEWAEMIKWIYAPPNGGQRDVATAGRLKASGTKAGVWDICLPFARGRYHCMYIEMKKPVLKRADKPGAGLSDVQIGFGKFIHTQGGYTKVAYTWYDALRMITDYFEMGPFSAFHNGGP